MEKRILIDRIAHQLVSTPKGIVLLGPRQTGKSTLLKSFDPDLTIDLADEFTFREHLKDPRLLRAQTEALKFDGLVFIDEIQRIPSMLNTVQSLMDHKRGLRFLMTGSSARKLKRGQVNLLPGRVFRYDLFPLTFWELADKWDLIKALTIGTLPEIYLQEYGADLISHYIDTYLREEIQAEAITRNVAAYARFLDLAAESSGQIINYSQLSSDSEIPKETLRRYFDILADTLLVHRLPGYTDIKGSRKAIQKEIFLFFDMGVRNAVLGQHRNVFSPTEMGKLFEQWFILQIIAFNSYYQKGWKLFFYRDDLKQEVDLIIDRGKDVMAIEIKYSERYNQGHLNGLKAFASYAKKPVHSILIYRGDAKQSRDDISIVPYEVFLRELQ